MHLYITYNIFNSEKEEQEYKSETFYQYLKNYCVCDRSRM